MASFSDNIMTFNPAVSQIPVDDYAKVGMIKQSQYDQGVQEIRNQLSNIEGLDILHPLQKEYAQSSLGNLKTELKKVGGADFSDTQLIGQIGGMASKISKDAIIKEAVASTVGIRRTLSDIEEARKAGKSSAGNEYVANNAINKFLTTPNLKASYRGAFKPYNDKVRPKIVDAIKGLVPNEVAQDIAYNYTIGKDGEINISGILDVMKRHKVSGIDEGKIKTVIGAVLDENDYDQLSIDGQYKYRNIDPITLQNLVVSNHTQAKKAASTAITALEAQLKITSDVPSQVELNNRITYYKNLVGDGATKGQLDQQLEQNLINISNDPDSAKGNLYTKNFIDEIANGFAYRKIVDEIHTNPAKEDKWKELDFKLRNQTENRIAAHEKVMETLAIKDDRRKDLEEARKAEKETAKPGVYVNAGDPTTEKLESLQYFAKYNNDLKEANAGILKTLSTGNVLGGGQDLIALKDKIKAYKQGLPKGEPANSAERNLMNDYIKNEQILKNNDLIYDTKKKEAYKELTGGLNEDQKIKQDLSYHNPLTIQGVTFTPKEVYDYLKKEKVVTNTTSTGAGGATLPYLSVDSKNLSNKEKVLYNFSANRYGAGSKGLTNNKLVDAYINDINNIKGTHKDLDEKAESLVSEKLADYTGVFRPEQASIPFKNNDQEEIFNKSLINIASSDLNKKTAALNYSPAKVIELLGAKKAGNIDITTVELRAGGDHFIKIVDTKDPKNPQIVPVSEDWVRQNTSLGGSYLSKNTDLAKQLLTYGGTTNITGKPEDSYFKKGEFGSVNMYGVPSVTLPVSADFKNVGGSIFATIYIKDKNDQPIKYEVPYPVDVNQFSTSYLPSLTDKDLLGMFKQKYPNIEQLIKK